MNPELAIYTFLNTAGIEFQKIDGNGVVTTVATDRFLVQTIIACVNQKLAVFATLPTLVPLARIDEFRRDFAKFNAYSDWGEILLNGNIIQILVTMGSSTGIIPEQVQLCLERALDIASSVSERTFWHLVLE